MKIYELARNNNLNLGQGQETSVSMCVCVCVCVCVWERERETQRDRETEILLNILRDQDLVEQTLVGWVLKMSIQNLKSELGESQVLKLHIENL